jgi:hypothetical protein
MEQNTPATATAYNPDEAASGEATPFPVAGTVPAPDAAAQARRPDPGAAAAAVPVVDSLLKRMTERAHAAIDGVADRLSSTVEGVQGGVEQAGQARDEWLEAAREAIRQHPLAAVAGAALVGLAVYSLASPRGGAGESADGR